MFATQKRSSFTPAPGGRIQRACAGGCGGQCAACGSKKDEIKLQRFAQGPAPSVVPPIVHEVTRDSGRPLDAPTRRAMEARFGHDFGKVRVHDDARAAESARSVHALAYTVGRDVVFGEGQYRPGERAGRRLLAHELAHVLQQPAGSPSGPLTLGAADDHLEQEAERAAAGL